MQGHRCVPSKGRCRKLEPLTEEQRNIRAALKAAGVTFAQGALAPVAGDFLGAHVCDLIGKQHDAAYKALTSIGKNS